MVGYHELSSQRGGAAQPSAGNPARGGQAGLQKLGPDRGLCGVSRSTSDGEAAALAGLIEQLSRPLHSVGYAEGLFLAQWTALGYFARAEPPHATATALARYQG